MTFQIQDEPEEFMEFSQPSLVRYGRPGRRQELSDTPVNGIPVGGSDCANVEDIKRNFFFCL
ncbi:hypothetical protein E2562_020133 [Oryza meyeriana var. granulata]|uniref:Uncharacterized protein n=1 Tax=Oryza meyeriana var. granulata TaxID=110450 RepID=A0A6G1BM90_9ORYZ|nr:hypothetical protein E2562_020133 [Oryza meyeriana var. granulata]